MIDLEELELAVQLSKVIHDAQDEHGLKTRHDIGLVLWAWLTEQGAEIEAWCVKHDQRDLYINGCPMAQRDDHGNPDCVEGDMLVFRVADNPGDDE